jgi:hypothetical protein
LKLEAAAGDVSDFGVRNCAADCSGTRVAQRCAPLIIFERFERSPTGSKIFALSFHTDFDSRKILFFGLKRPQLEFLDKF